MNETRDLLERVGERFTFPGDMFERLERQRVRKRRNQRIAAGVVGIAVFVAAVWIVTSGAWFDRTETPAVPGAVTGPTETGPTETGPTETGPTETGPTETGPTETGPTETGPTETGPSEMPQGLASLPVSATDYLVDLETGARTPLPKSIVGTEDVTGAYAVSPDGSRLAYVGRGDSGGVGIFVANLDGTRIEHVTAELPVEARPSGVAAPAWGAAPAWSPDGSKIAHVGRDGNVYLLDLATGVSTQVTDDPRDGAQSPTFSPDGSSIVYNVGGGGVGEVRIVPVAGGASVPLLGGDGAYAQHPALSPDGSLLSYVCGDRGEASTGICLANADGSGARVFVRMAFAEGPAWSPDGKWIAYGTWAGGRAFDVYVVDVATGEVTAVGEGAFPTWLDGHTLIVEADDCSLPSHKGCPF